MNEPSLAIKNTSPNLIIQSSATASEPRPSQDTVRVVPDSQDSSSAPTAMLERPEVQGQSQNQQAEKASGFGIAAGGGWTYLTQEELNKYFESLVDLGVQWIRWDVDWSVIQKGGPESFNWAGTDRVAQTAKRYGIESLGIIDYAPRWASDKACKVGTKCAPADSNAFAKFAGEAASRYKDSIAYWEIWNEPNLAFFWGPRPSAKKYVDILEVAYLEIKKANPSAIVLSGGLTPVGDGHDGSISPLIFMNELYKAGANQYFDAVAMHPYTFPLGPDYNIVKNSWHQMHSVRQLMVKHGDSAKKIWITELGAPTGGPGRSFSLNQSLGFNRDTDFMKESAQSGLLTKTLNFYHQYYHTDSFGPFFWYSLRDEGIGRDTSENFFGLLRYDWSKKPAYDVYKSMISGKQ